MINVKEFLVDSPPIRRRKTSRLAPWVEDIQTLKEAGYTLAHIAEFLERNGVVTRSDRISAYLSRLKKRSAKKGTVVPKAKTSPPPTTASPLPQTAREKREAKANQHIPDNPVSPYLQNLLNAD